MKIALVNPFGDLPERFQKQKEYVKDFLRSKGFILIDFLSCYSDSESIRLEKFLSAFESDAELVLPLCGGTDYSIMKMLPKSLYTKFPKKFCGGSSLGILCAWLSNNTNISVSSGQHITFLHPKSSFQENLYSQLSWWNFMTNSIKVKGLSGTERRNVYQYNGLFSNVYCFLRKQSDVISYHPDNLVMHGKTIPCSLEQVSQIPTNTFENGILITDSLNLSPCDIRNLFQDLKDLKLNGVIFTANQRSDQKVIFPEYLCSEFIASFVKTLSEDSQLPISYGFPFGHSKFKLPIPWMKNATYDGRILKLVDY